MDKESEGRYGDILFEAKTVNALQYNTIAENNCSHLTSTMRCGGTVMNEWISVRDFGAVGDGTTNDTVAIEAALSAIAVHPDKVLCFSGDFLVDSLVFPAGSYVAQNARFVLTNQTGMQYKIDLQDGVNIDALHTMYDHASLSGIRYVAHVGNNCHIGDMSIASDTPSLTEGCWVEGSNVVIGSFRTSKIAYPIAVMPNGFVTAATPSSNVRIGYFECKDYRRGMYVNAIDNFYLGAAYMHVRFSNSTEENRSNGILVSGISNFYFGHLNIQNSGGHAFRFGGHTALDNISGHIEVLNVVESGGCGLKINPGYTTKISKNITVGALVGVDVGEGTTNGNAEMFRCSHADNITIDTFICRQAKYDIATRTACIMNNVTNIRINSLITDDVHNLLTILNTLDLAEPSVVRDIDNVYFGNVSCKNFTTANYIHITYPNNAISKLVINFANFPPNNAGSTIYVRAGSGKNNYINGLLDQAVTISSDVPDFFLSDALYNGGRYHGPLNSPAKNTIRVSNALVDGDTAEYVNLITAGVSGSVYGGAVELGRPGGSARRGAAIAAYLSGSVGNEAGIAFLCGAAAAATDAIGLQMQLTHQGHIRPARSGTTQDLGSSDKYWRNGYVNSIINSSDARMKQDIGQIPHGVIRACKKIGLLRYRFIEAVQEKGDDARWHLGVTAQSIIEAFAEEGENAFDYGLVCLSDPTDRNSALAVRYAEMYALMLACHLVMLRTIEDRVSALELKLANIAPTPHT